MKRNADDAPKRIPVLPAEEFFDRDVLDKIMESNSRLWNDAVEEMALKAMVYLQEWNQTLWDERKAADAVARAYGESDVQRVYDTPITKAVLDQVMQWMQRHASLEMLMKRKAVSQQELMMAIDEAFHRHSGTDIYTHLEDFVTRGGNVDEEAFRIADLIRQVEFEVIVRQPDGGVMEVFDKYDIADAIQTYCNGIYREGESTDYMPTDDVADANPQSDKSVSLEQTDNATLNRFQTEAAAGAPCAACNHPSTDHLYESMGPGPCLMADCGCTKYNSKTANFPQEASMSDNVKCEKCGESTGTKLCLGCSPDGTLFKGKSAAQLDAEKQARIDRVRAQVWGLNLTASQKKVLADIEDKIMDYSEDFLESVGSIMKRPWDLGSAWEVAANADGPTKIVRRESAIDEDAPASIGKHAYEPGQELRMCGGVVPEDVIIRECIGEDRYKVQSVMSGKVFPVAEADLYNPNGEADLFDGEYPMTLADISQLF
jgi:hypothetical protein